jgi:hypothetical protein
MSSLNHPNRAIEQREQTCTKPRVVNPQAMIFTQHQRKRKTEPVIAKPPKYFKKADQCQTMVYQHTSKKREKTTLKSKHREV